MTKTPDVGRAAIEPDVPVAAGCFTTIVYTYAAGHPIDESGYVILVFRSVGDFGTPQFDQPGQPNFATIETTGQCRIQPRWDPKGHIRPWSQALYLKVMDGYLDRDEKVIIRFGDRSGGSPGWQMQTFCEETFEFKTLVDPIATFIFQELPHSPTLQIVPGEAARAVCLAPSQVGAGKPFSYALKLEDRWGNPVRAPQSFVHPGFAQQGVQAIQARDADTGFAAESNPIRVMKSLDGRKYFWADFHGQSEETIGSNSIEDYFRFAKEMALLDIAAHQGNDFQVTDAFWEKIQETTKKFYDPGKFVSFPGYEWSGNTPLGGDRNVYFFSEGGRIARSSRVLLPGEESIFEDAPTANDLFAALKEEDQPPAFVFAHVGGRYADLSMHDPAVEIAVEVHSAWGTFDWLIADALRLGYRIGICANSDGHKCRPGASYPGASEFGSFGGLTCVLAEQLDRESIYDAMKARRFYATSGQRSLVDLVVSVGGQRAQMGDVVEVGEHLPRLQVRIHATSGVEHAAVYNGLERIALRHPGEQAEPSNRIRLQWSGAEIRGRARRTSWDGTLRVEGNRILCCTPINFWKPTEQPLLHSDGRSLEWRSSTTGGIAGLDLWLEEAEPGRIDVNTAQGQVSLPVNEITQEPRVWAYGGIAKELSMYRLAERLPQCYGFDLALHNLHPGDNPIYLRIQQEDGHLVWTSPVYLHVYGEQSRA